MRILAGVDGCKGGWVVATLADSEIDIRVVEHISEVLQGDPRPVIVCIDMPIGLLDEARHGGRACDVEARKLLGKRASAVFPPPVRAALNADGYEEAVRLNRASSPHEIGISRQSYGILPRIREVDGLMTPELQEHVVEVHPELVFYEMNDGLVPQRTKKTYLGMKHRIELLDAALEVDVTCLLENHASSKVAEDDIVDALAALWTAGRVAENKAIRVPENPTNDSRGLRMEIVR